MNQDFYKNKVIWITGASSGIGRSIVELLSEIECTIIISSRRSEELKIVVEALNTKKARIHILAFDLLDISDFPKHTETIVNTFGKIDILFNNGGISQRSLVIETPIEVDRKLMEVNYFSNIYLAKCVLPYMINQKFGIIAVTSSISGKFGFYLRSGYSASKHALHGYYESLYLENRTKGINVTMICPGSIRTEIALKALNSKGEPYGLVEERLEKGMDSFACAKLIIKGVAEKKRELLIGKSEIIPVYLKRYIPLLFWRIIERIKT